MFRKIVISTSNFSSSMFHSVFLYRSYFHVILEFLAQSNMKSPGSATVSRLHQPRIREEKKKTKRNARKVNIDGQN